MAHYVVSDIHGEASRFYELLEKIHFLPEDRLYILGDVVDRGPDGLKLLLEVMKMTNVEFLLGNHEHTLMRYLFGDTTEEDMHRWTSHGGDITLEQLPQLPKSDIKKIRKFLTNSPSHIVVSVGNVTYYLVHGFPAESPREEIWGRPDPDAPNPRPGCQVIIGHTPVCRLGKNWAEQKQYLQQLQAAKTHMKIFHGAGFMDIDCGCGHPFPERRLACLRLEDQTEYYV